MHALIERDEGRLRVGPADFDGVRARIAALGPPPTPATPPFLVVTPLGVPGAARLAADLAAEGVTVRRRLAVADWATAATRLYARAGDAEDVLRLAAYEAAWRSRGDTGAEAWVLGDRGDYERVRRVKYALRERFRSRRAFVYAGARRLELKLHAFHLPDTDRLAIEWALLTETGGGDQSLSP